MRDLQGVDRVFGLKKVLQVFEGSKGLSNPRV